MQIYDDAFIQRYRAAQQKRAELHASLWRECQEYNELLSQTIPRYREFYHALEIRGDIPGALATGVLAALKEEGYARTSTEHLTPEKLRTGCRAWVIEWLGFGGLTVDRTSADQPQADELWHRVELVVKADRATRRIDTEFFSLNEQAGDQRNPFDDREKLHVVWEVPPAANAPLELVYLGLGTNEPYDLEHLDRGASTLSGRPRFYIFDRVRGYQLTYCVRWDRGERFDWDWGPRPLQHLQDGTAVSFVELPDRSLVCVSDEEIARAAQDYTLQMLVEHCWSAFELPGEPLSFEELDPAVQEKLLDSFRRVVATVSGPHQSKIAPDAVGPSLTDVLDAAGRDYLPYFVATSAARARERGIDRLLAAVQQLEPSRAKEYEEILGQKCVDVFAPRWHAYLPSRMSDLIAMDVQTLPSDLRGPVQQWVENLSVQIDRDLYHYGQNPAERIHRLRLGAGLALCAERGAVYDHVLNVARDYVTTGHAHGCFDITWP